jgi:hypothetical protein
MNSNLCNVKSPVWNNLERVTKFKYTLLARKSGKYKQIVLNNVSDQNTNNVTDCSFCSDLITELKEKISRQKLAHMQYVQMLFKHNETMYLPTAIARNTAREDNDLLCGTVHCTRQQVDSLLGDRRWSPTRGHVPNDDSFYPAICWYCF